jgi:hypothetical protein
MALSLYNYFVMEEEVRKFVFCMRMCVCVCVRPRSCGIVVPLLYPHEVSFDFHSSCTTTTCIFL